MDITILLTYGFLLLSVISIWSGYKVFYKFPLWLIFLILSFGGAFLLERASVVSVVYTTILGFVIYYYYQKKSFILFFLVLILSIPLMLHFSILGFDNYKYLDTIVLTPSSSPYSLYFNLDKTAIGIFIIACSYQVTKVNFLSIAKHIVISLGMMAILFFVLATVLGYSKFEPKLPYFTPIWILVNLFFTCLAEEAIFRRLIQQKIYDSLPTKYALGVSLSVASLAFGLAHFNGGILYIILATIAGVFYGYIYHKTKRVESAMLLHMLFNLTHLLLFTYPSLAI